MVMQDREVRIAKNRQEVIIQGPVGVIGLS